MSSEHYDAETGATYVPREESVEHEESPVSTPEEAYARALKNLSPEQMVEFRSARINATRAGMPDPMPPGYQPPAAQKLDQASQIVQDAQDAETHAETLADLDQQIQQAQASGDWTASRYLKYARTDLVRAARRAEERKAGLR